MLTTVNYKELSLMFRIAGALIWPWANVQVIVDDDLQRELKVNSRLAQQTAAQRAAWKKDYTAEVQKRISLLRRGLVSSFLTMIFGIVFGYIVSVFWIPPSGVKALLGVTSVFCFAWATLARLGKPGTSIGGQTAIERYDRKIFWVLYWFGMAFGTLALI